MVDRAISSQQSAVSDRPTFGKTPEESIAEVLSRYSVTDLVEQAESDLARGDTLFYRSQKHTEIFEQGETNMIRWWRIKSGETVYEARRFKNFVWCSCKSFFFTKRMCKHLAMTAGVYCISCRQLSARIGKLCYGCHGDANNI